MHKNQRWNTKDDKIVDTLNNIVISKPAIIVDLDTGKVIDSGEESGLEWVFNDQKADNPKTILIYFRNYHTKEEADAICTLLNRMSDDIGKIKMLTLVSMLGHEEHIKTEVKQLQQQGY